MQPRRPGARRGPQLRSRPGHDRRRPGLRRDADITREPSKPKSKDMPQNAQTVIIAKKRRLEKLEERQAIMGISTPPEVLTEIEDLRREIGELEG
jgi:hypothetical protein